MKWTAAQFSAREEHGIRCTLCPHECLLKDGETGQCHVRRVFGSELQTATFATTLQHLDPIERKPLYHFRPGSKVLTLAAPGCSFRCLYCQNFRLSQYGRIPDAASDSEPADCDFLVRKAAGLNANIGLSYSEPSLAAELTLALAEAGRSRGVQVVWKSNGFLTRGALGVLAPRLAAVNLDIKAASDSSHVKLTGASLRPVVETLDALHAAGVWVEISTPLIPGFNDDDASIIALAKMIRVRGDGIPWHLLRFTPDFRLSHLPPTHPHRLETARQLAMSHGLKFVYVERAIGEVGRTTFCPGCQSVVVSRDIWSTSKTALTSSGHCAECHCALPGRWN